MVSPAYELELAAVTHPGAVRAGNDDTVAVDGWIGTATMPTPLRTRLSLDQPHVILVCDGMGGQAGGATASRLAATDLGSTLPSCSTPEELAECVRTTSQSLHRAAVARPDLQWMGTTVAGMLIGGGKCFWYNVGDSSVFRFRNFLFKLSLDDTPGGERTGAITQALGGTDRVAPIFPHVGFEDPVPGTAYLICSDGLTDALPYSEIGAGMVGSPVDIATRLLQNAIQAGASDNVSILVAQIRERTEGLTND